MIENRQLQQSGNRETGNGEPGTGNRPLRILLGAAVILTQVSLAGAQTAPSSFRAERAQSARGVEESRSSGQKGQLDAESNAADFWQS